MFVLFILFNWFLLMIFCKKYGYRFVVVNDNVKINIWIFEVKYNFLWGNFFFIFFDYKIINIFFKVLY